MSNKTTLWPMATFLLLPFVSSADDAIDEIVVTADYLNRSVSELPASISVMDVETIESLAVQHFEELVNVVPNLNWSGDGHRARYFQIRGIGERSQYQGAPNPSVGFIVDDIDFSGIGTIATLFDVERVEVLRGPQAIRYGANALAGLIYMQSAALGTAVGRVKLGVSSDNGRELGIAGGGTLGQGTDYRLSAHQHRSDGFRENSFLGRSDTNGRDETTLRAKINHDINDELNLALVAMFVDVDDGYDAFAIDNSYTVLSDNPGKDAQRSLGASARLEWDAFEDFRLTSITAFADSEIDFDFDADWGNPQAWAPITYDFISRNDRERSTLSQELRFSSLADAERQWLAGVYALRLDEDLTTVNEGVYDESGVPQPRPPGTPFTSGYESTSIAVFGQVVQPLSSTTDLDLGLRVEHRSVDYSDTGGVSASPNETMIGGHVALTHTFSATTSGFVGLSRGFKAGGFNLGIVPDGRRTFDEEVLWNLEVGVDTSVLDERLLLNATLFYSVRDDQQVNTSFQIDPNDPATFVFFTDNATESRNFGVEATVDWRVNENWQVYANLGLLDSEFEEFVILDEDGSEQVNNTGRELAHAPSYTLAAGAAWRHPAGWFARADVTARDSFFFSDSHNQQSKSYSLTNLRVGYDGERWQTTLWVRNLFDEQYAVRGFFFGNEPPNFPATLYTRAGDPRQVGLSIERRF